MSERTQEYRKKMREKGLVQVRVWVDKQDEKFIKYLSKFCREERPKKEKQRSGRLANSHQIRIAKAIASANNIPEPKHLHQQTIFLNQSICMIIILAWPLGCGDTKECVLLRKNMTTKFKE